MTETVGFLGLGNMGEPTATSGATAAPKRARSICAVAKKREHLDWSSIALGIAEEAGLKPTTHKKVAG